MTKVAILPVATAGGMAYWAMAGARRSEGATAGSALDALIAQMPPDESGTLIVVQSQRPDQYFTADQQHRLAELMAKWRTALDAGSTISPEEQAELDALVASELRGAGARAAAIADELHR